MECTVNPGAEYACKYIYVLDLFWINNSLFPCPDIKTVYRVINNKRGGGENSDLTMQSFNLLFCKCSLR